jgi:hypothetical protein
MNRFTLCKNIQKTYHNNCNDFIQLEIAEIAETELKLIGIFIGLSGIIYLKNNKDLISEFLFQIGYHSFLAVTKLSNAYTKIKNYFVSSTSNSQMNRQKTYIYDEVKVIKNGVRNAHFETMETFKESCYLGNPNDYYDMDEVIEDSTSSSTSSFDSDTNECSSSSSPPSPSSQVSTCEQSSSSSSSSQPLFIMEKNESSNTIDFKTFDFIMHTNYMYPESTEQSIQSYTKLYRTFVENDFNADKATYEKSNAEMIICNIEIEGDEGSEGDDIEEYEIELTHPYNFNIVGNIILDEKFVYWYMLKKYNYALNSSSNYKVTCITKDIKTFQLDRSCGLRVNLNEYEKVDQPFIPPSSSS